jgi:hypothetical protein
LAERTFFPLSRVAIPVFFWYYKDSGWIDWILGNKDARDVKAYFFTIPDPDFNFIQLSKGFYSWVAPGIFIFPRKFKNHEATHGQISF